MQEDGLWWGWGTGWNPSILLQPCWARRKPSSWLSRGAIPCIVMLVLQRSESEEAAPYCASNQPKENLADHSISSASFRSKGCIQESSSLSKHETHRKQSSSKNWTSIIQRLVPCNEWRSRMMYRLLEKRIVRHWAGPLCRTKWTSWRWRSWEWSGTMIDPTDRNGVSDVFICYLIVWREVWRISHRTTTYLPLKRAMVAWSAMEQQWSSAARSLHMYNVLQSFYKLWFIFVDDSVAGCFKRKQSCRDTTFLKYLAETAPMKWESIHKYVLKPLASWHRWSFGIRSSEIFRFMWDIIFWYRF